MSARDLTDSGRPSQNKLLMNQFRKLLTNYIVFEMLRNYLIITFLPSEI